MRACLLRSALHSRHRRSQAKGLSPAPSPSAPTSAVTASTSFPAPTATTAHSVQRKKPAALRTPSTRPARKTGTRQDDRRVCRTALPPRRCAPSTLSSRHSMRLATSRGVLRPQKVSKLWTLIARPKCCACPRASPRAILCPSARAARAAQPGSRYATRGAAADPRATSRGVKLRDSIRTLPSPSLAASARPAASPSSRGSPLTVVRERNPYDAMGESS